MAEAYRPLLNNAPVDIAVGHRSKRGMMFEADVRNAEMRHRLFNCFEVINSLVTMRLRGVKAPAARQELEWFRDVLRTMGALEQGLAQSDDQSLVQHITHAANAWLRVAEADHIDVVVDCQPVHVPPRATRTLSLILHELISNCVKHAFPDGDGGRITIALRPDGTNAELLVSDDGRGFKRGDGAAAARHGSMGLSLIARMARGLGGTFDIDGGPRGGTVARVTLPRDGH